LSSILSFISFAIRVQLEFKFLFSLPSKVSGWVSRKVFLW
jgi:hypothetical protein